MIRFGKKSKILAAVLAAGIILSMQGMTHSPEVQG